MRSVAISHGTIFSGGVLLVRGDVFCEHGAEHFAHERLDKEHLRKKCERHVKAHQFEPVCQQRQPVESRVVRIVQKGGEQTHCGTHQADGRRDDCGLKNDRIVLARVEFSAGEPERKRASHAHFQCIGERELNDHDRPNRQHIPEHIHAALFAQRVKDACRLIRLHECRSVHHVQAVKNKGVHGHYHRNEREHHPLKLISWHFSYLFV